MPWAAAAGAVVGAVVAADGSKSAARTQANAANRAAELQNDQYLRTRADLAPQRQTGYDALNLMRQAMGLAPIDSPEVIEARQAQEAAQQATAGLSQQQRAEQLRAELAPQFTQMRWSNGDGEFGSRFGRIVNEQALEAEVQRRLAEPAQQANVVTKPVTDGQGTGSPAGKTAQPSQALQFRAPASRLTDTQTASATARNTQAQAAPTDAQALLQMDPSYRFRLKEGMAALEGSAAARGGALSGTALKAGQTFAQDLASTEYGSAWGRAMQLAGREWDQNNQLDARDWAQASDLDSRDWSRAWDTSQDAWNRTASLAGLGQNATASTVNAGTSAANSMASLLTQSGNATAAGQIATANSINAGIGNAANAYNQSRMLDLYLNRTGGTGGTGAAGVQAPAMTDYTSAAYGYAY